eukprot:CAMPEP_0194048466 /NCGR_PEP_ID=MMETSP0009_2-20130614/27362_1 /TAXON_ID=210454 /ORGANISM="Grammatophora oceanica, Strain CCMP 410" /LENGTH=321 /DNA_ID=CAMNT_0038694329 /DNA_START=72 /DNA_END=1037 /DNA_ORIENTATION=+
MNGEEKVAAPAMTVQGYSFYLNVMVVNSNTASDAGAAPGTKATDEKPEDDPTAPTTPVPEDKEAAPEEFGLPEEETPTTEETAEETSDATPAETNGGGQIIASNTPASAARKKYLMDGKAFMSSITKRAQSLVEQEIPTPTLKTPDGAKKLVQDSRNFMGNLGTTISKRANAFVASKTMMSRAQIAVEEAIPLVTKEMGAVELSITKRFQQGPVFVLEVDMKGCNVAALMEATQGKDAAQHYEQVVSGLQALDMKESLTTFQTEVIPLVRTQLMQKASELIPAKMKSKPSNADLEIECIALDDQEEAKYLFNFLAFMEQMK